MLREFLALLRRLWMSKPAPPLLLMAAKIGESARIREISILNPDWASVGGAQCHNFSLLAADVETYFLCKDFKSPGLLLDVRVGVIIALNSQHNLGLPSKRREST